MPARQERFVAVAKEFAGRREGHHQRKAEATFVSETNRPLLRSGSRLLSEFNDPKGNVAGMQSDRR